VEFYSQAAYKRLANHTVPQKVLGKLLTSNSTYVGEVLNVLDDKTWWAWRCLCL